MNGNGESRKETTGKMMEILNAKTQTRLGLWDVRTMFETDKLAQFTSEMNIFWVLAKADRQIQASKGQAQAKQFCILAEMTTCILRV